MDKLELNSRLFDTILKAAVEEDFQRELDALPAEGALKKEYEPSTELRQKIRKIIKSDHHKVIVKNALRYAKKVAVIIAIIIPISLGSLLSVEASRNIIFNSVFEWKADHVDIYFKDTSSKQPAQNVDKSGSYQPQYLPEGFSEIETVKYGETQRIKYQNKEKVSIVFEQTPLAEEGTTTVDTEHSTYKEITINGQKASLFAAKTPNDKTYILWQNGKTNFLLNSTIDQQELIKIAENIKIKNN